MRFVRRSISPSWDESRFASTLAPSLTKNISSTKIPANKTVQIVKYPGSVTTNAAGTGSLLGPSLEGGNEIPVAIPTFHSISVVDEHIGSSATAQFTVIATVVDAVRAPLEPITVTV
jgi:hypothetical protein